MTSKFISGYVVTLKEPLTVEEEKELREYLKFRRKLTGKAGVIDDPLNLDKIDTCIVCAQGKCCCEPRNNWRKK